MNPFTQALMRRLEDSRLEAFIERWDTLEALVIRVYRRGRATESEKEQYARLRAELRVEYPRYRQDLRPYWEAAGDLAAEPEGDPFERLIAIPEAGQFADNWTAMQTLPGARQALNEYLVARIEAREG